MTLKIVADAESSITNESAVCHYDQLTEETKEWFPRVVHDGATAEIPPPDACRELGAYDYVKFTRYYRVTNARRSGLD